MAISPALLTGKARNTAPPVVRTNVGAESAFKNGKPLYIGVGVGELGTTFNA